MKNYRDPHYHAEAISGIINTFGPPSFADQQASYDGGGPALCWVNHKGDKYAQLVMNENGVILYYDPFVTDCLNDKTSLMVTGLLTVHDPGNPACIYQNTENDRTTALTIEEVRFEGSEL